MPSRIVPFLCTLLLREAAAFSALKTIKSRNRSTLRDVRREMHVSLSAFRPHIELYGNYTSLISPIMKVTRSISTSNINSYVNCTCVLIKVGVFFSYLMSDSSVGIATDYGLDGAGSNPGED